MLPGTYRLKLLQNKIQILQYLVVQLMFNLKTTHTIHKTNTTLLKDNNIVFTIK